jgi:hypothetical protein
MEFKKKELTEIIGSDGNLIGNSGIPTNGADLESQANNTTDYNAKIGVQPFRYDMLGRFGFTLMPFLEGKESQEQLELLKDLDEMLSDGYKEILEHYYKNPNKLKSDYRKLVDGKGEIDLDGSSINSKKIVKIIEKHFENAFDKEPKTIDEAVVAEDKMVDKSEDEMSRKSENNDVREKKLEKIAGLINKLDKKDIDKLMTLLEVK